MNTLRQWKGVVSNDDPAFGFTWSPNLHPAVQQLNQIQQPLPAWGQGFNYPLTVVQVQ
jgi:hypothetical protein